MEVKKKRSNYGEMSGDNFKIMLGWWVVGDLFLPFIILYLLGIIVIQERGIPLLTNQYFMDR